MHLNQDQRSLLLVPQMKSPHPLIMDSIPTKLMGGGKCSECAVLVPSCSRRFATCCSAHVQPPPLFLVASQLHLVLRVCSAGTIMPQRFATCWSAHVQPPPLFLVASQLHLVLRVRSAGTIMLTAFCYMRECPCATPTLIFGSISTTSSAQSVQCSYHHAHSILQHVVVAYPLTVHITPGSVGGWAVLIMRSASTKS